MKNRLPLIASILFCAFALLLLFEQPSLRIARAKTASLPTPLPLTCSGATACAYGYVYFDGAPVKIDGFNGTGLPSA